MYFAVLTLSTVCSPSSPSPPPPSSILLLLLLLSLLLSSVLPVQVCVEYEVLSYLHRMGLPVPKPYHQESREGVIGTEFFIMEFVNVRRGFISRCLCVCVCVYVCMCMCIWCVCMHAYALMYVCVCAVMHIHWWCKPFLLVLRALFLRTTAFLTSSQLSEGRCISL